jgi:class 3 adenylate cyclase
MHHNHYVFQFDIFTSDIIQNVQWENNYNFALLEQLSAHVTSDAVAFNATFPNWTVPNFEIAAGYVNGMGGMIACAYAPLIEDNQRAQWEQYALSNVGWVNESLLLHETHPSHLNPLKGTKDDENEHETAFQGSHGLEDVNHPSHDVLLGKRNVSKSIYHWENGTASALDLHVSEMYVPIWQLAPAVPMAINSDLLSSNIFKGLYSAMKITNQTVISPPAAVGEIFDFLFDIDHIYSKLEPHSFVAAPVFKSLSSQEMTGMVIGLTPFDNLLDFLFDDTVKGIMVVFTNNCGTTISYDIDGAKVNFLGYSDFHNPKYELYKKTASLELDNTAVNGLCLIEFHIYPSSTLEQRYTTKKPYYYAGIVLLSFFLTSVLMIIYDLTVTKRQEKTMRSALQNGALVESLFPSIVRERLLEDSHLNHDIQRKAETSRPIAEFFPCTTIMFADIAGFTAWSSTREPFQVFELLETIYGAFDELAKRRRIFKVETVGDCYVAVSGIPEARNDHAVAMAKFARDCLYKMKSLTAILEVKLGPDTSALAFRVGLHSGSVTGGVLRGDNARFQLFGDTVNTAARMESTGLPNMIQVSQATANLLIAASKEHWIKPRDEKVLAKGKGHMTTYWLSIGNDHSCSRRSTSSKSQASEGYDESNSNTGLDAKAMILDAKMKRLVDWNVQVLLRFIKKIVARRVKSADVGTISDWENIIQPNVAIIDEVAEIIALPKFTLHIEIDSESLPIDEEIERQLKEYVTSIAKMYRNNPFHNFEHASHVTMVRRWLRCYSKRHFTKSKYHSNHFLLL